MRARAARARAARAKQIHQPSPLFLKVGAVIMRNAVQGLGPPLAGLEKLGRRVINHLVWDLIRVCIDAPGDWL
jgi:hypothetical protein